MVFGDRNEETPDSHKVQLSFTVSLGLSGAWYLRHDSISQVHGERRVPASY